MAATLAAVVLAAAVAALFVGRSAGAAPAAVGTAQGVRATAAPWPPEHRLLERRVAPLGLPPASDNAFHVHVWLHVFAGGRPVAVPASIGIDPAGRFLAPLHTHDASGIVHVEAVRPYPFTLGQLFAVWGVRFTRSALGAYPHPGVWVDGRAVADGPRYLLRAHDSVVVGTGPRGSFSTTVPVRFPPGL